MAKYSVYVPDWRPASTNELFRRTLGARIKLERRDYLAVLAAFTEAGVPTAVRARLVSLVISTPGELDRDAPFKSVLDALVRVRMLTGDRCRDVELAAPCYLRGPKWTVITLEDMDDEPEFLPRPRVRRPREPRGLPGAGPPDGAPAGPVPVPRRGPESPGLAVGVPRQSDLDFVRDPANWRGRR